MDEARSEAMMANWHLMMLDRKNNEHTEESDGLWRKALDLCVPILSMPFVKLNGAVIKWCES
jgi:hypothetical protein